MPVRFAAAAATLTSLLLATASAAAEPKPLAPLLVGDDAPELRVGRWLKGTPVEHLDRGTVYVIELWTASTSPCLVTLPHFTDLAKRYPAATCIAVGLNEAQPELVGPFVKQLGDRFDVRAAMDATTAPRRGGEDAPDGLGPTARDWFFASGGADETDMPVAYIVNADGVVAWIGRPMRVEAPLKAILAGTYDLDAARRASIDASAARAQQAAATAELVAAMNDAGNARDQSAIVGVIDRLMPKYPDATATLGITKFYALMRLQRWDDAYASADEACDAAAAQGKAMLINNIAWFIVDNEACEQRDVGRARRYAELAVKASDATSGAILDTLAKAQFMDGDAHAAAATEARAAEICGDHDRDLVAECLRQYTAAAATQPAR